MCPSTVASSVEILPWKCNARPGGARTADISAVAQMFLWSTPSLRMRACSVVRFIPSRAAAPCVAADLAACFP